ncbi:MAG TPA: SGNH/GDSL hydrolase family protein [Anaerolineales bacterium]|nr:SGNH/GDSL hydrolase family protein [Anaerolineales bacterium]
MKRSFARFTLLFFFLTTACYQELQTDASLPVVTSVATSGFTPLPPTITVTPTSIFSPAQALAAGPINIIAIGDDFTQGEGDTLGRGYTGLLIELASQIRPGSTIVNFGRTGWDSNDLLNGKDEFSGQLDLAVSEVKSAASQRRAAVVLVWVGGNDLWELYSGTTEVTIEMEEQDALRFAQNMDTIVFELRNAKAEVIIAKLDDQSQRPAKTRGEVYPDITNDELLRMSMQVQRYNESISAIATKYNALTVDFFNSEIFTQSTTLAADGYHPNPTGYELISQAWYKALIKILP